MTYWFGRTAGRKSAAPQFAAAPTRGPHFSWPMLPLAAVLVLALSACGVKSDLMRPNGNPTPKSEDDPSKPPYPLGR